MSWPAGPTPPPTCSRRDSPNDLVHRRMHMIDDAKNHSRLGGPALGLAVLSLSIPAAFLIARINNLYPAEHEKAALVVGACFAVIAVIPGAGYLALRGRSVVPMKLALVVLSTVATVLVSFYLYWASHYTFFPADILLWSESDFTNDILKISLGYPLYTDQVNNESFVYTPGTQALTYLLAALLGHPLSISLWRVIQLFYVLLAALVSTLCCMRLTGLAMPAEKVRDPRLWSAFMVPVFFLLSSNSLTNPYVHNLHNDALALLLSVTAYWLLVEYTSSGDRRLLFLMAALPAAGFLVKQSLAIWAALYCLYLFFFDTPRSPVRTAVFGAFAFGAVGATVGASYLLWGNDFIYWVFTVMKHDPLSPLRSVKHILTAWTFYAAGLVSGLVLFRGARPGRAFGAWLLWLLIFLIEGYTSGIGWMLNHMGPGSLIAGIWLVTALVRISPPAAQALPSREPGGGWQAWLHAGVVVIVVGLLFNGMGLVRVPVKHLSDDAYRYIAEIEHEFEGVDADKVLLDVGTWVYLDKGVVMKDRAIPIGNRGYNGTGDFSGIIGRIKEKRYAKILVRNLDAPIFLYDHWLWPEPSGIKDALLDNYRETGKIKPLEKKVHEEVPYLVFDELTILTPRSG